MDGDHGGMPADVGGQFLWLSVGHPGQSPECGWDMGECVRSFLLSASAV